MTAPLVVWLYPPSCRSKGEKGDYELVDKEHDGRVYEGMEKWDGKSGKGIQIVLVDETSQF